MAAVGDEQMSVACTKDAARRVIRRTSLVGEGDHSGSDTSHNLDSYKVPNRSLRRSELDHEPDTEDLDGHADEDDGLEAPSVPDEVPRSEGREESD